MRFKRSFLVYKLLGKVILFILAGFFCTFRYAQANTYYFSSSSGNDSYTIAQAQNPRTPWKTIKKLNHFFSSLQAGDSVLFKTGDTFYGTINIKTSGVAEAPIVLSSYGKGNKPVITSLVSLIDWVFVGNGIWECFNSALRGAEVNVVLMDGVLQEMGRHPNSDEGKKRYLTIDSSKSKFSITDPELPGLPNWTGAEVVIRKNRWTIDRNKITAHQNSTMHFDSPTHHAAKNGFGYFIQNHIKTLDRLGEWYYDPVIKKMYFYFGESRPSTVIVEAASLPHLVFTSGSSHVSFTNITFKGANEDSFKIRKGTGLTVSSCEILFSGRNGLKGTGHANLIIEDSRIAYSNGKGISLNSSNQFPVIRNNIIEKTGLFPGMGAPAGANGIGILCYGKGALIEFNKILNSGYNGIAIKLNLSIIKNNLIRNFCSVTDDGGGIYSQNAAKNVFAYAIISGNIIEGGMGAPLGTDAAGSNAEGIYMDDYSNSVLIENNTISNCNRGIYLHNVRNIRVTKNTCFNNEVQFFVKSDKRANPIRDLAITNNIFFSKFPAQLAFAIETIRNDIDSIGDFDSNYYARPLDDRLVFYTLYKTDAGVRMEKRDDLEGWQCLYGKDGNSKKAPKEISSFILKSLKGPNKVAGGTFTTKEIQVFGNHCSLKRVKGKLLDGEYLQISPSGSGSSVTMSVGALVVHKTYMLRFSVSGGKGVSIGAFLRYGGSPYKPITPIVYRKVSPVRRDYEILLTPSVKQESGTLVFTVDQAHDYFLDNVQLYEASVTRIKPEEYIRFEYNFSRKRKRVLLNGNYIDVESKQYANSVEVAPFSSVILLKQIEN